MPKENDIVLALIELGYSKIEAKKMAQSIPEGTPTGEGVVLAMKTKKPSSLPTVNAAKATVKAASPTTVSAPKIAKVEAAASANAEIVRKFNEEETEKRVKAEEILTKAIKELAKTLKIQTDFLKRLPKLPSEARISRAAGEASPYKTIGERLMNVRGGFTVRNMTNKIGLIKKGSGSMFDDMLGRREEMATAMKQQRDMEVDKDESGKPMSDKDLKARILRSQKAAKELARDRADKEAYMKDGKFTKEQFNASNVGQDLNRRINVGTNLVEANNPALKAQAEKESLKMNETSEDQTESIEPSRSTAADAEKLEDQTTIMEEQTELLKAIRDNTGGKTAAVGPAPEESSSMFEGVKSALGGIIGGMIVTLRTNIVKALKFLFNPAMIFKAITKVFVPLTIIASIFSGIMDGWKEYQKSGSILEAIVAGVGGMLDFLTFGLFDKDTLKNLGEWINSWSGEFIQNTIEWLGDLGKSIGDGIFSLVESISKVFDGIGEFLVSVKDDFLKTVEQIGIPKFKVSLGPLGDTEIGPFYPFKGDAVPRAEPKQVAESVIQRSASQTANQLNKKSEEVVAAREAKAEVSTGTTTVVSAPVTNNSTAIIRSKGPERNTEPSSRMILRNNYA